MDVLHWYSLNGRKLKIYAFYSWQSSWLCLVIEDDGIWLSIPSKIKTWLNLGKFNDVSIYVFIIIITIKSRWQHGFPWLSIRPYHPSLPNYIQCPHRANVNKFLLVGQLKHVHVLRSLEERHRWVHPDFSSILLSMSCSSYWMVFEMGGKWPYSCCFVGCCFQDLSKIAGSNLV